MMSVDVANGRARITDRGEFRVGALGLALLFGVLCLINTNLAPAAVRDLPDPVGVNSSIVFGAFLVIGAVLAAEGGRRGVRGALMETAGLGVLAVHGAFYIAWTAIYVGSRSLVTMIFLGGLLGLPSAARGVHLWRLTHSGGRLDRVITSVAQSRIAVAVRTIGQWVGGFLGRRDRS